MRESKKRSVKILKRVLLVALSLVLAFGSAMTIMASNAGDLNGDGKITAFDAQMLAEYQAGERELSADKVIGLTVKGIIDWILGRTTESEDPTLDDGIETTFTVEIDESGIVTEEKIVTVGGVTATVPVGVAVSGETLTLSVVRLDAAAGGVTVEEGQEQMLLDIHVEGVAPHNTVPVIIYVAEALDTGLNLGNVELYHVENDVPVAMTQYKTVAELTEHNSYCYDPATGDVTVAMASFSAVAFVSDIDKAWEGNYDYSWYNNIAKKNNADYTISNADQLAGLSAIVGGMDGQTQDSFAGKTVKLIADINLNVTEEEKEDKAIFYPIGYYNTEGTYEKTGTAITSGFKTFEGTFDGQGHTISNFYQNTWEMKGDNEYYAASEQRYRDGMGLFGKVYGGTVKNLTVENFSSDGEFTTTGTIAAYADCGATFENIAIFNCNPRVYNIGNGGIVGCVGWYAADKELAAEKVTFKNITVDNSNKISALWGSWDVACGGLIGQYYPTSGQSSANYPVNGGISFENCHVAAQIDVYNDVCANYQYYAYRYAGMMIGSIRENETIDGHVYPKMDGITADNCTVHYETWNDYYYCELVANSLASYTHDHQMSRLTEVAAINGTSITYLDGTTGTVPASGSYNYVVVEGTYATENATCYHFVDGVAWDHATAGTETVDGVEVLKEDKQHIYLPFNQLFTGYGWGVTSKGLTDYEGIETMDITESTQKESVEKFAVVSTAPVQTGTTITLGELFAYNEACGVELKAENIRVAVTDLNDTGVSATYTKDDTWTEGTLKFSGTGKIQITIQDYYFCNPATVTLDVGQTAWTLVTDASELTAGDKVVIAAAEYAYALSTNQKDNNRGAVSVTKTDDKININGDVQILTLETGLVEGTWAFNAESGYLYAASSSANNLKTKETLDKNGSWLITIDATTGDATIVAKGEYTRNTMQYNNGNATNLLFACYESASQKALAIYKLSIVCGHENANTEVTKEATCTENGIRSVNCPDCSFVGEEEIPALGHSYEAVLTAPTCTAEGYTTHTCSRCDDTYTDNETNKLEHNFVEGNCTECGIKETEATTEITFELGANGSASHSDGSSATTYSETVDSYTLNLTNGSNFYTGARDAKGNSCIKLGTGSNTGSFKFTVPDDVDKVIIEIGKYKANATIVSINSTSHTISGASDNGAYDAIEVDTTINKSIAVATTSSGKRAMVNSITYVIGGGESGGEEACAHANTTTTTTATCTEAGIETVTCDDCGETVSTEVIEALGHNYVGGACTACGAVDPNAGGGTTEPSEPVVVLEITVADFNGTSYAANNNTKTENGYSYTSYQVMNQSSVMQWQKSKGYITIASNEFVKLELKVTAGTFTVTVGGTTVTGTTSDKVTTYDLTGLTGEIKISVGSATGKVDYLKFYK